MQVEERRLLRSSRRHALEPFEHEPVVVHRVAAVCDPSKNVPSVTGRTAAARSTRGDCRTAGTRSDSPVAQHVLQLEVARADVAELAAASVLVMPQKDSEQVEKAVSTFFIRPLFTSATETASSAARYP